MGVTEKTVNNILGDLYEKSPDQKYCDKNKKHKYHKGIGKGKQCIYCGHLKNKR